MVLVFFTTWFCQAFVELVSQRTLVCNVDVAEVHLAKIFDHHLVIWRQFGVDGRLLRVARPQLGDAAPEKQPSRDHIYEENPIEFVILPLLFGSTMQHPFLQEG